MLCASCGEVIPLGRGQKNGSGEVHPQTKYCSAACRITANNARHGNGQRLFPEGTSPTRGASLAGPAAEHMVVTELLLRGYVPYMAIVPTLAPDMIADIGGHLYRVEVKAARRAKNGKVKKRGFGVTDSTKYDVLALAFLASHEVVFVPPLEDLDRTR